MHPDYRHNTLMLLALWAVVGAWAGLTYLLIVGLGIGPGIVLGWGLGLAGLVLYGRRRS